MTWSKATAGKSEIKRGTAVVVTNGTIWRYKGVQEESPEYRGEDTGRRRATRVTAGNHVETGAAAAAAAAAAARGGVEQRQNNNFANLNKTTKQQRTNSRKRHGEQINQEQQEHKAKQ